MSADCWVRGSVTNLEGARSILANRTAHPVESWQPSNQAIRELTAAWHPADWQEVRLRNWVIFRNRWLLSVAGLIVALVLAWSFYWLFGHSLIERAYNGAWPALSSRLMAGRTSTSLESYLLQADDMMRLGTIWLLSLYVATLHSD